MTFESVLLRPLETFLNRLRLVRRKVGAGKIIDLSFGLVFRYPVFFLNLADELFPADLKRDDYRCTSYALSIRKYDQGNGVVMLNVGLTRIVTTGPRTATVSSSH